MATENIIRMAMTIGLRPFKIRVAQQTFLSHKRIIKMPGNRALTHQDLLVLRLPRIRFHYDVGRRF
jgi:hypothetical protein